jgi:hypothetical protein
VVPISAAVIIIQSASLGGEVTVESKEIKTAGNGGDPPSFPMAI